jgi:predicted nucleotide-binding protein
MAAKSASKEPEKYPSLQTSRNEAELRINDQIQRGEEIVRRQITRGIDFENTVVEALGWERINRSMLAGLLDTEYFVDLYDSVRNENHEIKSDFHDQVQDFKLDIERKITRLQVIWHQLGDFGGHIDTSEIPRDASISSEPYTNSPLKPKDKRVFIVHGHDEEAKHSVARVVEKLGLEAIILHEQVSRHSTIIEKLEVNSDVVFAVVLLTPDDIGASKKDGKDRVQERARQNVILELGYFIGRLGRSNVCALYKEGVEIPSDFSGVVYTPMDSGGAWRYMLAKELKAAGLDVDLNKL